MANLQVKSIDDELYEALGRLAAQENRSISQEVVYLLKKHLSQPQKAASSGADAFLDMIGSWQGDESAEEMIADIRKGRETSSGHREVNL